jgi:hypothetical protein
VRVNYRPTAVDRRGVSVQTGEHVDIVDLVVERSGTVGDGRLSIADGDLDGALEPVRGRGRCAGDAQ